MNYKEQIMINDKVLQFGVLSGEKGYQVYLYPGMTVNEIAFDTMVVIRLLIQDGYIKSKSDFDKRVKKYFADPQYQPLKVTEEE